MWKPWSDVKNTYVLSSSPLSLSALMRSPIMSSTASMDCNLLRLSSSMYFFCSILNGGLSLIQAGLLGGEERGGGPGRAADEVGCLLRENVVEVVTIGVVAHDVTVLVEVIAQEIARHGVPYVPPWRSVGLLVAIEILPEEGRPVALLLDPGGYSRAGASRETKPLGAPERRLIVEDLVVVGVLAA